MVRYFVHILENTYIRKQETLSVKQLCGFSIKFVHMMLLTMPQKVWLVVGVGLRFVDMQQQMICICLAQMLFNLLFLAFVACTATMTPAPT